MTNEELKEEAEKQGYYLAKKRKDVKLLPCKCGTFKYLKRYKNWGYPNNPDRVGFYCTNCGTRVTARWWYQLKEKWNEVVSNGD